MKLLVIVGIALIIVGIIAVAVPSVTFFTTERVADVGFIQIDVSKPHTILLNPVVGGIAIAAGVVAVLVGLRSSAA